MTGLHDRPFWTRADQAELNVLVQELVADVFEHREGCAVCAAGFPPCPWVRAAIERVLEWREEQIRRSKAAWLRAHQDLIDQAAATGGRS